MDFSIGDIIFFGAIAIAVISNIVKQLKKREQPQRQPVPVPTKLEDYFQKVEKKKETPFQSQKPIARHQPIVAQQPEESILEEELSIENEFNLDFSDISEVKKGIIYTEIFNKKY